MKTRLAVLTVVLAIFCLVSSSFAGDRGERNTWMAISGVLFLDRQGVIDLGQVPLVGDILGSRDYRHHRQTRYSQRGYSGCDQYRSAGERSACQRGMSERNAEIQMQREEDAYRRAREY